MYFYAPAKKIKSRQNTKHYEPNFRTTFTPANGTGSKNYGSKKAGDKKSPATCRFFYIFTENPYIYAIIGLSLIKPTDFFYENYFYPQLPGIGNHTDCFFSFSAESGRFIDFGKSPGIHRAG